MTIEGAGDGSGLRHTTARLRLGYGPHLVDYFKGRILEVKSSVRSFKATAYGPFKELAVMPLGEKKDFSGESVAGVFYFTGDKARLPRHALEVSGGDEVVKDAAYTEETTCLEVDKDVARSLDYVITDYPPNKRLVMPKPRPGDSDESIAAYGPSHYRSGDFSVSRREEVAYHDAVVFRRDQEGVYEVRKGAEVPDPEGGAKVGRTYYVAEFPGNARAARRKAHRVARRLASGVYDWSLNNIALNPEIGPYDTISAQTEDGALYECLADGSISFEITASSQKMSMGGGAVQVREPRPKATEEPGGLSAGVVRIGA